MSDAFDPYHRWLGIPPSEQPPHHCRLLALEPFEADENVIRAAADRQMGHLRTFQSGRHAALSQKLLNEVASARVCLLTPAKKREYDDWLAQQLRAAAAPARCRAIAYDAVMDGALDDPRSRSPSLYLRRRRRAGIPALIAGISLLVGAAALALVFALANRPGLDGGPAAEPRGAPTPKKTTVAPARETPGRDPFDPSARRD